MVRPMSLAMSVSGGASYGILIGSIVAVIAAGLHQPIAVISILVMVSGIVGGFIGYLWHRI